MIVGISVPYKNVISTLNGKLQFNVTRVLNCHMSQRRALYQINSKHKSEFK